MNKALLVLLFVILQIGAADAGIEVRNATAIWNASTISISQNLSETITNTNVRIIVEYANVIYNPNLFLTSQELIANISSTKPRIIVEYSNTIYNPNLTGASPSLLSNASMVKDRIIISYANAVFKPDLSSSSELNNNASLLAPRISVQYANSLWASKLSPLSLILIDIKNSAFNKSIITIPINTTVTWINFENVTHTVTADGGSFESGSIQQNQSFSYRFNKSGIFSYHCSIHPSMTGIVNVTSAENQILRADCGPDKSKCENAGAPVQFDGSASSGSIVSYTWNFGDGTNVTGLAPKHTYAVHKWNGTAYKPYTVNLTVTDNGGLTNMTSVFVTIWIAGDANGDGKVNILDASVIGLKWGTTDPCADLNNDGKVNIIDASIIGLNWGKTA